MRKPLETGLRVEAQRELRLAITCLDANQRAEAEAQKHIERAMELQKQLCRLLREKA